MNTCLLITQPQVGVCSLWLLLQTAFRGPSGPLATFRPHTLCVRQHSSHTCLSHYPCVTLTLSAVCGCSGLPQGFHQQLLQPVSPGVGLRAASVRHQHHHHGRAPRTWQNYTVLQCTWTRRQLYGPCRASHLVTLGHTSCRSTTQRMSQPVVDALRVRLPSSPHGSHFLASSLLTNAGHTYPAVPRSTAPQTGQSCAGTSHVRLPKE